MSEKIIAIAVVFMLPFLCSVSQSIEKETDSILCEKYPSDKPGAVFLVAKDGKVVYRKAFGKANLELDVNMKPENVFQIGSMTKQFTAIAIMMLEEAGKLKVTDDITKFIPDYPTHGKKITIHHLLTHITLLENSYRRI